jgi:hypothetical protein
MIATSLVVPIYCSRLHVAFSENVIKEKETINKRFPDTITEDSDFCAQADSRRNHILVVFNMKNIKNEIDLIETIAHESVHLTNFLFLRKGIKLNLNNDEPQAYLLGWITGEIYKVYLKFKAQKENGTKV